MKGVVAAVAVALLGCSFAAAATSPTAPVTRTIRAEAAAFNAHGWRRLWRLHSPRFHSKCNYLRYTAAERRSAGASPKIGRVMAVEVALTSATRAIASYTLVFANGGRKVRNAQVPFARVGTEWLEDYAPTIGCGY